jgi:hypothetical protein
MPGAKRTTKSSARTDSPTQTKQAKRNCQRTQDTREKRYVAALDGQWGDKAWYPPLQFRKNADRDWEPNSKEINYINTATKIAVANNIQLESLYAPGGAFYEAMIRINQKHMAIWSTAAAQLGCNILKDHFISAGDQGSSRASDNEDDSEMTDVNTSLGSASLGPVNLGEQRATVRGNDSEQNRFAPYRSGQAAFFQDMEGKLQDLSTAYKELRTQAQPLINDSEVLGLLVNEPASQIARPSMDWTAGALEATLLKTSTPSNLGQQPDRDQAFQNALRVVRDYGPHQTKRPSLHSLEDKLDYLHRRNQFITARLPVAHKTLNDALAKNHDATAGLDKLRRDVASIDTMTSCVQPERLGEEFHISGNNRVARVHAQLTDALRTLATLRESTARDLAAADAEEARSRTAVEAAERAVRDLEKEGLTIGQRLDALSPEIAYCRLFNDALGALYACHHGNEEDTGVLSPQKQVASATPDMPLLWKIVPVSPLAGPEHDLQQRDQPGTARVLEEQDE